MEFDKEDDSNNVENIECILSVSYDFFVLSGLGVNEAKTMLTLFGGQEDKEILA